MKSYVYEPDLLLRWLHELGIFKSNKVGLNNLFCGLSQNDITETYYLFFDYLSDISFNPKYSTAYLEKNKIKYIGKFQKYKGLLKDSNNDKFIKHGLAANELRRSAIEKGKQILTKFTYRKDLYSDHCKEYREYWGWVKHRNKDRYLLNKEHGQNYDSKNAMHMIRILQSYLELLNTKTLNVFRTNAEELLTIKNGELSFDEIMAMANDLVGKIEFAYDNIELKDSIDLNILNNILMQIRHNK